MTITDPNDFCYRSGRRSPAEVLGHGGHRFRHRERLRHDDQRDGDFSSAESLLLSRIRSADYGHRDDNRYSTRNIGGLITHKGDDDHQEWGFQRRRIALSSSGARLSGAGRSGVDVFDENGSGPGRSQIDSAVKGNLIPRKDSRIS
jgi:hypothetical protein